MPQIRIPGAFYRGGTSRAVMLNERDLASFDARQRDAVILAALGSPDPYGRQIDGLGGGISSLSKVCILDWVAGEVQYNFGQVSVTTPEVDWSGTCGNMSAAVGPFALEAGWLPMTEPFTEVPVLAVNNGKRFVVEVPVRGGEVECEGAFTIAGVPGPAARVGLRFLEPGGTLGRGLFPTGNVRDRVCGFEASIVDATTPTVFVRASDLGLRGTESAAEIDALVDVMARLESIRSESAVRLGLAGSQAIPKVAAVAPPVLADVDLTAQAISMQRPHRTYPAGPAICTAVAARVPDTIVGEATRARNSETVRIQHAAGEIEIGVDVGRTGDEWVCRSATTYRSARKIMDGFVYVPGSYLGGAPWFSPS
jgi:2-methylaconitate cis-trans-isomerase PrpF